MLAPQTEFLSILQMIRRGQHVAKADLDDVIARGYACRAFGAGPDTAFLRGRAYRLTPLGAQLLATLRM
ncbi:hypothetical protein EC845_1223 [Comamonas sp. BIGb0124]|nr:hypothetical protein EC845_1223 [Comamonas sp. BIGb0124]